MLGTTNSPVPCVRHQAEHVLHIWEFKPHTTLYSGWPYSHHSFLPVLGMSVIKRRQRNQRVEDCKEGKRKWEVVRQEVGETQRQLYPLGWYVEVRLTANKMATCATLLGAGVAQSLFQLTAMYPHFLQVSSTFPLFHVLRCLIQFPMN